ncbi:MAG: hypothetical protein JKY99_09340 [Rhizobiales bacterium]|nr:hypothetical protein [Hyphomicrobiales bacterium]
MADQYKIERNILVFSIWAVLGFLGLGLILEGLAQDHYFIALAGIGSVVAAFVAHIIVNAIFDQGFQPGEVALGLSVFGLMVLFFIVGWLTTDLSMSDYYTGITFFAALVVGFILYLSTRYGMRSAFSRFHVKTNAVWEDAE